MCRIDLLLSDTTGNMRVTSSEAIQIYICLIGHAHIGLARTSHVGLRKKQNGRIAKALS
jgi:hypothetical protein